MNIGRFMKHFFLVSLFLSALCLWACGGDNSSAPNEELAYSSDQTNHQSSPGETSSIFSSSAGTVSSESSDPGIIVMPPLQSSSSITYHFENVSGERVTCKGIYSNLVIQNVKYLEAYHCENGNTCAPYFAAACTETECRSEKWFACKDSDFISEEKFNQKYVLDTCKGGYCNIYCYNNEIALEDGDTLKVIECDNGLTYLRDGAYDRKKAGKAIPDTLEDKPSIGYNFAVNCDYGEELCAATTDEGRCFMSTNTIECPRKEQ